MDAYVGEKVLTPFMSGYTPIYSPQTILVLIVDPIKCKMTIYK